MFDTDRFEDETSLPELAKWVSEIAELTKPDDVVWCDGSQAEWDRLTSLLVEGGTFTRLNPKLRPNSFYCASDPSDVARVEDRTFICSESEQDAGPTNNWIAPDEMRDTFAEIFDGCMRGRTMYVIPFCMGPLGSSISQLGVEITDSPYVAVSMRIMTRMGTPGAARDRGHRLVRPGRPLGRRPAGARPGGRAVALQQGQVHLALPRDQGDLVLRLGLRRERAARQEVLRAADRLGDGARRGLAGRAHAHPQDHSPGGRDEVHRGGLPVRVRQDQPGHAAADASRAGRSRPSATTSPGCGSAQDGRLYAINPEAGFFGVAPGTGAKTNANAVATFTANSIFTNVALTDDGDVWWEGLTDEPPAHLTDWKGRDWTPDSPEPAAHPNSRFTTPAGQCPIIAPEWDDPAGVPISAILFGGRRASTVPLVIESFDWDHGVFLGANIASEKTAAAEGKVGELRHDPFAMLPFCGYNMGDYFGYWLKVGANADPAKLPRLFYVNWFRKNAQGKFVWPGFGENIRVLKWIIQRLSGEAKATKTPIGYLPAPGSLDLDGLDISWADLDLLLTVDTEAWKLEAEHIPEHFQTFHRHLPARLWEQHQELIARLG